MTEGIDSACLSISFEAWAKETRECLDRVLLSLLADQTQGDARLMEAMRYAVMGGGKRIRPLLVQAAGDFAGASGEVLLKVGTAFEVMHTYSLVHDDLPCMDDDVLRRGRPTTHVVYGEAMALLAGDGLLTLAFECLSTASGQPEKDIALVRSMARAAGARGMVAGQAIDLSGVGQSYDLGKVEQMHALKTGALISSALEAGALCGSLTDDQWHALTSYGRKVGLAFQVVDDILDATADTVTLGKTAGKDEDANKPTFVSLMGVDAARDYASTLVYSAKSGLSPWNPRRLNELADFVVSRLN